VSVFEMQPVNSGKGTNQTHENLVIDETPRKLRKDETLRNPDEWTEEAL